MSNSSSPSPRPNNWLATLVLALAAALGIPTAIIGVSTHFVTEHPLWSLFIALIFAIVVFAVYLIVRIWQRLEGPWLDDIAHLIDYKIRSMFSSYHKRYRKYLIYQHRDFDVKGLNLQGPYALELDQVFIELSIDTTIPQQMPTNPIPQELREGSHTIWYFLASAPLAKQNLVIIGPPGSGKTTLLKHITLSLVAPGKRLNDRISIPRKLPILLFLRDHANTIHINANKDKHGFTLIEALHDHLKRWEQPDPPAGWVKRQLDGGRCLVLLDGLDEVADPQVRKEVVDWVQKQMVAFQDNRFIITSRPFGFRDNPLTGVAMLEARPFTLEQVEQFVHKWYLANEIMSKQKNDEGVHMRARADAKGLLQQLYNNPTLLALTVNPLLLTMIAIVHRYGGGGKLPEKRVSLYTDICKVFLGKRQEAKGQQLELKPEQMQLVLEPLAFYMMQQGIRDITPAQACAVVEEPLGLVNAQISSADFLKLVENVSGLLLERENGIYSFAHLTFQEYLTAMYIREKQWGKGLARFVENSWWRETIRLYCAMADATAIVVACLAGDHPSVSALVLAFDCQKEALKLDPEVKARLETILSQGLEDADARRQHIAAEVLLARRLNQMVYLKEGTYIDTSLISCAEYQLFLDEQRIQRKCHQPDHWRSYHFSPGQGSTPVLGVRSLDAAAFCEWLTARETGPWRYRLSEADELRHIGDENILNGFPIGSGYWSDKGFAWLNEPILLPRNIIQELIARDFVLARDRDRDLALASKLIFTSDRTFDLAIDLNQAFDSEFDGDLDRSFDHNRGDYAHARGHALASALANYTYFSRKKGSHKGEHDKMQQIINSYLDIYIALLILEERIQGKLPACEGILIVKERKQKNA